jgi:hypothetical protein
VFHDRIGLFLGVVPHNSPVNRRGHFNHLHRIENGHFKLVARTLLVVPIKFLRWLNSSKIYQEV